MTLLCYLGDGMVPAETVRGVRVEQGELEGLVQTTEDGFKFLSFRGIPYAAPPVGNLRFKVRLHRKPVNSIFRQLL